MVSESVALSLETKMKLYNSCVQSRMLYNAGASVYTRVELDKLDAAHRRHLRRILGVFYPEHISNEEFLENFLDEIFFVENSGKKV